MNVHAISDDDWTYVISRIRDTLPNVESVTPISSTEFIVDVPDNINIESLHNLKFIDKVGTVIAEFSEESLSDLLKFLKRYNYYPLTKVRDFRIKSVIYRIPSQEYNQNSNYVIIRDYYDNDKVKVLVIKPLDTYAFQDLHDMWYGCFSDYRPIFVVSGLCSENEVLSCVRLASALRIRLILVNPRLRFSCRKKLEEFKKFVSLSKCRIVKDINSVFEKYRNKYRIIGMSMHSSKGEVELLNILRRGERTVFLIGGERWGLSVREVEKCDYVIRLGPSTGVPMSSSEVIAYVTSIVRLCSMRRLQC